MEQARSKKPDASKKVAVDKITIAKPAPMTPGAAFGGKRTSCK